MYETPEQELNEDKKDLPDIFNNRTTVNNLYIY